jgi:hypothetical protein
MLVKIGPNFSYLRSIVVSYVARLQIREDLHLARYSPREQVMSQRLEAMASQAEIHYMIVDHCREDFCNSRWERSTEVAPVPHGRPDHLVRNPSSKDPR